VARVRAREYYRAGALLVSALNRTRGRTSMLGHDRREGRREERQAFGRGGNATRWGTAGPTPPPAAVVAPLSTKRLTARPGLSPGGRAVP